MEKTAIEWFVNKLDNWGIKSLRDRETIIKQAKELEKEMIIKAFNEGESLGDKRNYTGIVYYNETFKSE